MGDALLGGSLGLVAPMAALVWLLLRLRMQSVEIARRIDALAARMGRAASGATAPDFALAALGGGHVRRDHLLARGKPLLLFFTDPRCGPCYELLPDVGGWQRVYGDRLSIAVISGGTPAANRAMTAEYGVRTVLLQADNEVVEAYGIRMAPAAIVVRPDGRLGGEAVYGEAAVRQLVADTLGLAMPAQPAREVQAIGVGEPAPAIRRPALDGTVVDLAAFRGEPTLVLFWNPGCAHCQTLVSEMKTWEADPELPRMIIVSRGPVALNQAAALRSPLVLDDDRAIAGQFGARGTPAAVLIDEHGIVVSDVARGATGVRALVAQRLATAGSVTT